MMMCCQFRDSNTFLFFSLWLEAKLFIVDRPLTLVSFIDWLDSSFDPVGFLFFFCTFLAGLEMGV